MDERVKNLKTPEACIRFAKFYPDLALDARIRRIELQAFSHDSQSTVETELLKALYAYEEVLSEKKGRRTHAARTWQMIKRHGIIGAAERAVNRKVEPTGYKILADIGMHDLTFEAVILKFPNAFSNEAVLRAKARLKELESI